MRTARCHTAPATALILNSTITSVRLSDFCYWSNKRHYGYGVEGTIAIEFECTNHTGRKRSLRWGGAFPVKISSVLAQRYSIRITWFEERLPAQTGTARGSLRRSRTAKASRISW